MSDVSCETKPDASCVTDDNGYQWSLCKCSATCPCTQRKHARPEKAPYKVHHTENFRQSVRKLQTKTKTIELKKISDKVKEKCKQPKLIKENFRQSVKKKNAHIHR